MSSFFLYDFLYLFSILQQICQPISHTVPAVTNLRFDDVLPARIRALRNKDHSWQNAPEQRCGHGTKRKQPCYAKLADSLSNPTLQ
jgi:hypothetical protein